MDRLTKEEIRSRLDEEGQNEGTTTKMLELVDAVESLENSLPKGVHLGVILEHLGHRLDACGLAAKLLCMRRVAE